MPEKRLMCADPRADNMDRSRLIYFEGSNPVICGKRERDDSGLWPSSLRGRRPADDVLRNFQSLVEPPDIFRGFKSSYWRRERDDSGLWPSPLRGRRPADDVLRDFQSLVEPPDIFRGFKSSYWRRERDSNPRNVAVYTLSRRAPSATRPPLRYSCSGMLSTGRERLNQSPRLFK